jgi:hypothetical protein
LPILDPAEVKNFPGELSCPIITGSERTIIMPPIKNANTKDRNGNNAFFLTAIKNGVII